MVGGTFGRSARVGLVALVVLLFGGLGAATARAAGYDVFVGYADTLRPSATTFPTPFDTGPGITNLGDPSSASLDSGTVRVVNTSGVAETVNSVVVHVGSTTYDLWPHNTSLASFGQLVLDQNNGQNFDSSDAPSITCTPDGIIPTVDVTVNGSLTSYADTGQVLNTGGIDPANCGGSNESTQWVSIGAPPCPTGAVLTESPASQTHNVGSNATVTANFSACGGALQGATVNFAVTSGPNAGHTGSGTVDGSGNATFTYSSSHVGTDTVVASVTNAGGTITSNSVSVVWTTPTLTGHAYALSLSGLITVKPTPDTGAVSTTQSSAVTPPCVADLALPSSGSLVHAQALCAAVFTDAPGKNSFGGASVASVSVGAPAPLPAITVLGAQAKSKTTCAGSAGEVTVLGVRIGSIVLLPSPTKIAPNTTINVGLLKIVFNEQIPLKAPDHGLTVNAVHITALGGAVNLIVASAESDISGCT